jgi:hypothetical protein
VHRKIEIFTNMDRYILPVVYMPVYRVLNIPKLWNEHLFHGALFCLFLFHHHTTTTHHQGRSPSRQRQRHRSSIQSTLNKGMPPKGGRPKKTPPVATLKQTEVFPDEGLPYDAVFMLRSLWRWCWLLDEFESRRMAFFQTDRKDNRLLQRWN